MHEFAPLESSELRTALAVLLATPGRGRPAGARHVDGFCEYLNQCPVRWQGLRAGPSQAPTAVFFSLLLPGATAIVMLPSPGELGIDASTQTRLAETGLAALADHRLHYAQVLLEPEAASKRVLINQLGFQPLAPLLYLERPVTFPWVAPPDRRTADWVQYDETTRADFAAVIEATYERSADCPELTGLRPMDDVLASHRATGHFDAALWELARVSGEWAACLLLSRSPQDELLEVVYMGVVPRWRGRGVGELVMQRAFEQCRAVGARRLTVVVDERNAPARRLYERFALTAVARREAYLYRWPAADG